MVIFLIGVIMLLTVAIVLLCIQIRLSRESHRGASARLGSRIEWLQKANARNGALLVASDDLQHKLLNARRELDRMLMDAASDRAT